MTAEAPEDAFDLVVIGSGPAGERAAAMAAWFGHRVALVERSRELGGAAAHRGTLSSKTLREAALTFSGLRQRDVHGVHLTLSKAVGVRDLLFRERQVRAWEVERIGDNLSRHGVELIYGTGRLADPHTVVVDGEGGHRRLLSARFILVATGSHPNRPAEFPFELEHVYDSDEILDLASIPTSLSVVGGGVIGAEYACIFAALGVPVTLIEPRRPLLGFLDAEIREHLLEGMRALGIRFRFARVSRVQSTTNDVTLFLDDGEAVTTAAVLVAYGRTASTAGLGLEALGIPVGPRGHVEVDARQCTCVPSVYAAGDVVGFPALASTAMEQGRVAVSHAFGIGGKERLAPVLPFAIYTIPEASMAGETEEALVQQGVPHVVGRCGFPQTARGRIVGEQGLLKLLFHGETRALLGVHVVGEGAGDLVHQGMLALLMGARLELFIDACFNYPTLSEAYKIAAYDALRKFEPTELAEKLRARKP